MTEENLSQLEGSEDNFQRAGQVLAEARTNKGLSLDDVSARLKISPSYLRALESCDYDQLPGTAFIRGYLRSYARLVELDEEHVLSLYGETVQAEEQVARLLREKPLDNHGVPKGQWLASVSLVLLIAFVAGSVFWWNKQAEPDNTDQVGGFLSSEPELAEGEESIEPEIPDVVQQPETQVTEALTTDISAAEESVRSFAEEPAVEVVSPVPAPLEVEKPLVAPAPAPPVVAEPPRAVADQTSLSSAIQDVLVIRFSEECWVEVRDADGKILFADLKPGNSELTLTGDGPLSIKFGNVSSVAEVVFNGKPVTREIPASLRGIGRLTLG